MTNTVFVINSGSSSVKYQLLDPEAGTPIASGLAEKIGLPEGQITHKYNGQVHTETLSLPDHDTALRRIMEIFEETGLNVRQAGIVGVGHRIVQGGAYFDGPALITPEVHEKIRELCDLAPLHNPAHLKGIDVAMEICEEFPHVAVFDTAFFANLPEKASTYALNKDVAKQYQIRRYGAHGTSHQYVAQQVCDYVGRDDIKQITLHIGNGASATAEIGTTAIDTSMGLTPLEGLMMGTRTGDIDPAAVFHLIRQGLTVDQVDDIFNKQSGLKGLCGDSDMREVWTRYENGDPDAKLAVEVYTHRLLKYVGAYTAILGGLDVLSFTAGVGENGHRIREDLCRSLEFMGVEIDPEVNRNSNGKFAEISTPNSKVKVLVVPTNEELAIARQVVSVISGRNS